jgi:TonB family protein
MTEEKKNKIIGAATSGGVHLLILLLVFLLLASAPPIEKEEEPGGGGGGNPVGEGQGSAEGEVGGAIQPVEIAFAPMPESYVGADISAPTISESKTPVDRQNKPSTDQTQTAQTNPQPSALDNMLNQLNGGGGSDASSGGGSGGSGGGTGGGDGGGNGPGSGSFTGSGFGNGTSWSLKGRGSLAGPSTSKKPTQSGTVVVNITVDKNGNVTNATVNQKASSIPAQDYGINTSLAIEAAKRCKFTASPNNLPQTGTITIVLDVK